MASERAERRLVKRAAWRAARVVDIDTNPLEARRRRQRVWLRVGLPVGCVALVIAATLAIALYAHYANRRGVLALSDELLVALETRTSLEVAAFLTPAAREVTIAADMIKTETDDPVPQVRAFGLGALRAIPWIDLVSLGDADGNYLGIRRTEDGGAEIKTIRNTPGPRTTTLTRLAPDGRETGRTRMADDGFDPRTRNWYQGALSIDPAYWTDVYIFFTRRAPGITVAQGHRAANGQTYVIGLDITLAALSDFLASLKIGRRGRAVLIDDTGKLIAAPTGAAVVREVDGNLVTSAIDQLGDPVLIRTFDQFRVEGPGRRIIEIGDEKYITTASRVGVTGQHWNLLVVVPEDDFTGFVAVNQRNALLMSLGVVAIAGLLGALLVRQGLRADRGTRLLLERQRAFERQSAAFSRLAGDVALFDPTQAPPRALTETLADVTQARRASVWRLGTGTVRCEDSFERDSAGHVDGFEIHRDELPQLFPLLLAGETIEVADAARDRRTAELHRVLMSPLGSRRLLAVPVHHGARVVGSIWLEDAAAGEETREFVRAAANMVALRMEDAVEHAPRAEAAPVRVPAPTPAGTRSFVADLRTRRIDAAGLHAEVFTDVTVMVLQFTDSEAMAARCADAERALSDEIACALQEIATSRDVPYLKIVGHEAVAAVGFGPDDQGAPLAIADMAVTLRDRCIQLYEDSDRAQDVRIGIDCGPAIGCAIGREPRVFNLWGDAVRTAHAMAASAWPGTVQISQTAYERLRHDFLFRPRGRFYLPRVGEAQTFVLAGRP